jgi:ATP-dependent DNA ligase
VGYTIDTHESEFSEATMLAKAGPGLRVSEHIEGDGPTVFAHACKMELEGINALCAGS